MALTDSDLTSITAEISSRLEYIFSAGSFSKFTSNRKRKLLNTLTSIDNRVAGKLAAACGLRSQNANPGYYEDMSELGASFSSLALSDELDAENMADLYVLLERYIQVGTWDCAKQGYGPDPSDLADSAGTTCTNSNKRSTWKCRLRYRLATWFQKIFNITVAFP